MNCNSRMRILSTIGFVMVVAMASYPHGVRWNSTELLVLSPRSAITPQFPQITPQAPVFAEWIAHGSGCHAKSNQAGDVVMERIAQRAGVNDVHTVRFHLDQLQLTSAGRDSNAPRDFAIECALRVQVIPPAGKRIKLLRAQTSVVSVKSVGTKLTLAGTLKIGAQTLGQKIDIQPAGQKFAGNVFFDLAPGSEIDQSFPRLACGEPKLGGFDFTWIAERNAMTDEIFVEVSDDKVLEMVAELEDCQ